MNTLEGRFNIRGITIKNRFVLPPLTSNYGTDNGHVTPETLKYYKARSKDVGIVIVEAAAITPEGRIVPNGLGLWDDNHCAGMTELADTIKAVGAKAVIQLVHAGAKACPSETSATRITPSAVACRPGIIPVQATIKDIEVLIKDFTRAAVRAKNAGFEGVEFHGSHFYLLSEFLSPLTNHRTDKYGGSIEGRATLAVETVKAVREKLGSKYPIFFRLHAFENMEGGMTSDEAVATGKILTNAGVDVLDLSKMVHGSWNEEGERRMLVAATAYSKNDTAGGVTAVAARFRSECGVPVIAVGKLGSRTAAEKAIESGADMVAIGRQMICDPNTVKKILGGKENQILECEVCNACHAYVAKGNPLKCKQNKNLPE